MLLDSSGNLGLGVTPSAWGSNYRVLDMVQFSTRTAALFGGSGTTGIGLSLGVYHNNSNWIASVSSAPVAVYEINGNGAHTWSTYNGTVTAGNTISFTQVMTLDASGRLLVGTTSNFGGAGQFAIDQGGGTTPVGHLIGTASVGGGQRTVGLNFSGVINDTGPAYGTLAQVGAGKENSTQGNTAGYLSFATIPNGGVLTERARIDSSGNLLVGTTSVGGKLTVEQTGASANGAFITNQTYNYQTLGLHNTATANDNLWVVFGTEASFTGRGSISYNRAGGLTAYNTTSDYRAKDVTGPVANSGATIDALKVYNGKMKGATVERPMLIAHEAQAVTPYAVTGEKDAVDEDGKPKYQQMDVSSLVPLLIAEIQSLRARVAQLEAK
jgi:hypothetical protein